MRKPARGRRIRRSQSRSPAHLGRGALACVVGGIDLVRPLGLAGIPCAVMAPDGDPARYSRFTRVTLAWIDPWDRAQEFVEAMIAFAATQPERPVLFYESDAALLSISRFRDRLAEVFRFVIPRESLVLDLVDKSRFLRLASEVGLPVPRAEVLSPDPGSAPVEVDLRFPIVVKPLTRRTEEWAPISGSAKAAHVETQAQLGELWPTMAEIGRPLLAQEAVPGPESEIESYHGYVDAAGTIVAEFTGKKLRTYPEVYGYSTALVTTQMNDVTELGREIVRLLRFTGVLKCDFKRHPSGELSLLEVNPRFTLWHHLAAKAGLNIPALVYEDLTGLPRRRVSPARAGARWCYHLHDARAARATGVGLARWAGWAATCEAKSAFAMSDPLPFLRGVVWNRLARTVSSRRGR